MALIPTSDVTSTHNSGLLHPELRFLNLGYSTVRRAHLAVCMGPHARQHAQHLGRWNRSVGLGVVPLGEQASVTWAWRSGAALLARCVPWSAKRTSWPIPASAKPWPYPTKDPHVRAVVESAIMIDVKSCLFSVRSRSEKGDLEHTPPPFLLFLFFVTCS